MISISDVNSPGRDYTLPDDNQQQTTPAAPVGANAGGASITEATNNNEEELLAALQAFATNLEATSGSESIDVLNRILKLLIELTKSVQGLAVAQANNLNVLTKLQNAYVKLQSNIPVILKNVGNNLDQDTRNEINQKFGALMEMVRANRGMVEDETKKNQTMVNTSKEAATQLADLFNAFIDLIRSVLSVTFR